MQVTVNIILIDMTEKQIREKALEFYPIREKLNKKVTGVYDPNAPRRKAYIQGGLDALYGLWKNAEGNDLPPIDKDVIVLVQHLDMTIAGQEYIVGFAHRVAEDAEVSTSINGQPLTMHLLGHGKNRWSIPGVKYWLDLDLPKINK